MRSLFVLSTDSQTTDTAESFSGDELVVLVVVDKNTLATSFDDFMDELERKAYSLKQSLISRGKKCKVVFEWGEKSEAVANALLRENAQLLA